MWPSGTSPLQVEVNEVVLQCWMSQIRALISITITNCACDSGFVNYHYQKYLHLDAILAFDSTGEQPVTPLANVWRPAVHKSLHKQGRVRSGFDHRNRTTLLLTRQTC